MEQPCPGCVQTGQELTEANPTAVCSQCGQSLNYEPADPECEGCLEVAAILRRWYKVRSWGGRTHEGDCKQSIEWMNCDECGITVVVRPSARERIEELVQAQTQLDLSHLANIETMLEQLLDANQEKLKRLHFWFPKSAKTVEWLLKNGVQSDNLRERVGFGLSFATDRWLTLGEVGKKAAREFGERLLREAAVSWLYPLQPIPEFRESSAGSKSYGRPILLFSLEECDAPQWVSVHRYLKRKSTKLLDNWIES